MADTKQFNPLPLLSVKSGLDSSLVTISSELENYFTRGLEGQEHLQLAHDELHRSVGVLQMLSLEGLAVFCRELETVLQEMLVQQQAPTSMHRDTLRGAMLALAQYLDALAGGASNTALRLFYSYQELHQLRGLESAFEGDLFFPEIDVELPAEVLNVPLAASAAASLKKARAQYQIALLKWLRQDNPAESLSVMHAAVQTVMACAPQDQSRAFWWIAAGLLDCLILDVLPAEMNANKLLAKIDLQMKSMVENTPCEGEYNTTCSMLYLIARSHAVNETVDKIKQTYVLGTYLPEEPPLPHGETAQVLEQMHDLLNEAQGVLEQCEHGDANCSKLFVEQLGQMYNLSESLDRDTLQFLCRQMQHAVADTEDTEAVHRTKTEMAMAMLVLGNGIERYQRLGGQFHEQARMIIQYLHAGVSGEAHDEGSTGNLSALHCQMEEQEVLAPLATEMQGNLQQIELSLNAFFSDASKRSELTPSRRLLAQLYGGFYMLSLDVASQLTQPVQQAVERFISGATPLSEEMGAMASAVSALENYVHDLAQGQKPDTTNLKDVLQGIRSDSHYADQQSEIQAIVAPAGVAVRDGGEDAELLEVFLEEAQEVLETLHANLQTCQHNPHSREALITIRRGFHTLKGSGRMVGLTNLGEVAWAVEKALNKWLQDDKATTTSLLELIGDAAVLFQHWVDKLRSGGSALIDANALIASAQRIESGVEEEQAPAPAAQADREFEQELEQEPEQEPEPVPELELETELELESELGTETGTELELESEQDAGLPDIVIGNVSLSPILFNIAINEAASIIETLLRLVAELRNGDEQNISYDFVRAAHTLTGVNRSTGFTVISDLAAALELWLQECMDLTTAPDIPQLNLLEETINALEEMVGTLRNKQEPKPRTDLIERLQMNKKHQGNIDVEDSQIVQMLPDELKLNEKVEQKEDLQHHEIQPVDQDIELVSYAQYIAQEQTSAQLHEQEAPLPPEEIMLRDQDMDLVAYVQRVAQEQAIEPLQWQSVEEPGKPTAENAKPIQAPQSNEVLQEDPESHIYSYYLGGMRAGANSAPEKPVENAVMTEDFELNFGEPGLIPPAEMLVHSEQPVSYEQSPDIQTERGNQQDALLLSPMRHEQTRQEESVAIETPGHHPESQAEEALSDPSLNNKKRIIQDDLDDQLLPIFLEEADELYPQLAGELINWRTNQHDHGEGMKIARKLQRSLHTLKGSARMAGAMRLGELTHRVEDCLDSAVAEGRLDTALLDELENYFDRIGNALEKLRTGDVAEETAEPVVPAQSDNKNVLSENILPQNALHRQVEEAAEERRESAVLRVRSDIVDDLVNEAGEISVARSRMEVELNAFKGGLLELTGSVQGLRKLVREIEMHAEGQMQARAAVAGDSAEKFDPLEFDRFTRFQELTRFISESVHDVQTVQQTLLKNLDETSAAMSAQAKLNTGLQQSLMSIRMLPFSSISQRLYRIVRQTGKELEKKVNLELYGAEIELDRGVLEKMTAPFEHLLRNAIVHGLENPEQRERKGKLPIGNIVLTLRLEGNEAVFQFKDDGAGLDTVKLRKKAIEQGLLQAKEAVSEEQAMLLIFETGLSTAAELTEVSGRGVGMDVVRSEIKALGGRIEVSSEPDKGACFTIYLPLTLAVMKALLVRAGNENYAIPAVMVEQVQQIKPAVLAELYQKGQAEWQGKFYPLSYLSRLLGDNERRPDSKPYNAILLLRSGEQRMALHVDELSGNKEVVVKNVGAQLSRLQGIAGATVQANGKVVLILNPVPLAQMAAQAQKPDANILFEPVQRTPVVMIVDDSLTVRKITTRLLTRAGYEVVTAKDGVDALEKLVDMTPDVMLLDVEMPRMDGFELAKNLRRDSKSKNLPIIMITSRTAEKHRNYALEIGVNEYMGKPYQDDELLEQIARYAPLSEQATVL